MARWVGPLFPILCAAAAIAGCGGADNESATPAAQAPDTIRLSSPAFADGAAIPKRFTCDGAGTAPALVWADAPEDARELALVVQDPDAPGGTFVHWTAYGIPVRGRGSVAEGGKLPTEGMNSGGKIGWTPPCPPSGKPHHYVFTLYALAQASGLRPGAKPEDVRAALSSATARGSFTGTYAR